MTKAQQAKLNLELSERLMEYVTSNIKILKKYSGASYVIFSDNSEFNKLNEKLIISLKQEGRKVVKAELTKDLDVPWIFRLV